MERNETAGAEPLLGVRQFGWRGSANLRDKRLQVFEDRVELVEPSMSGTARRSILLSEVIQVSAKPRLFFWRDLLITSKSAGLRIYPLGSSDAEHARDLIEDRMGGRETR